MERRPSPLAERLGIGRGIIFHVDDLGMSRAGNAAFLELHGRGLVTSGSVMVPAPYFEAAVEAAAVRPDMDIGVHLTLTSEWEHHRWKPISTSSPASGLIDADGFFWRDLAALRQHLVREAAEAELAAQVERAMRAGLRPTHLDAHMAAAMLPELLDCHLALALEQGMVPVLPRSIGFAPDPAAYERAVAALEARGLALPDAFRGTQAVPAAETHDSYHRVMTSLPDGVTHMSLHCATPGDIEVITPVHAPWRIREYQLFASGAVAEWCRQGGIAMLDYRAVQQVWADGKPADGGRDRD